MFNRFGVDACSGAPVKAAHNKAIPKTINNCQGKTLVAPHIGKRIEAYQSYRLIGAVLAQFEFTKSGLQHIEVVSLFFQPSQPFEQRIESFVASLSAHQPVKLPITALHPALYRKKPDTSANYCSG